MPRVETKQHLGTQFYHSQFSNSPYLPSAADSSTSSSPPTSPSSSQQTTQPASSPSTSPAQKKKHVCGTCERAFTTSGHLARHSRVHTGERNHKCPFPGCETRCSRQDNLQQHYRIHLSPGSRRSSGRSAASRAKDGKRGSTASTTTTTTTTEPPIAPPPLSSPPALEQARIYSNHSTPPDSPPPLAQATLPATATLPIHTPRMESASGRSSSSSSPEASYSSGDHNISPMSSQGLGLSATNPQGYAYRSGTTTYQEQSQGAGFTYVHTTPVSSQSSNSGNGNSSFPTYSNSQDNYSNHSMQQQQHHSAHNRQNSPVSISSRHSISHISHPQSYSQTQSASAGPPSPASVSSHTSGPPTPTYPVFHDDAHSYHHGNGMIADHSGMNNGHMSSQAHLVHNGYSSNGVQHPGRFESPPPTLAPIQDERLIRREEQRHPHSHNPSPYIHHPQPLPTDYTYHQSMGLGHGAWKAESGMRKGVGAALV